MPPVPGTLSARSEEVWASGARSTVCAALVEAVCEVTRPSASPSEVFRLPVATHQAKPITSAVSAYSASVQVDIHSTCAPPLLQVEVQAWPMPKLCPNSWLITSLFW